MANAIELFKTYTTLLDEVYKNASLTSVLDGANELVSQGANANELIVPKIDMSGLADYSRNGGYVNGDVTVTNETVKANFDRGIMFTVDAMDDQETASIAYGRLASEFIRTKVVPELDAFRFATYASTVGVGSATGNLATGKAVVDAIRAGITAFDEAEVSLEGRYLFITPTLYGLIEDMDTTSSREVLSGVTVVKVPQTRFYTKIKQNSGGSNGYGYAKDTAGVNINFMLVQKDAVIQFDKHVAPKVITPDQNQTGDGWKFGYRNVSLADVYENKVAGVYVHSATTTKT